MTKPKSTEEQNVKIDAIVGDEVLGYDRTAQGEHSGQQADEHDAEPSGEIEDALADNRPDQVS